MNRAEAAARQYRVEAGAKVLAKQDIRALQLKHTKVKSKLSSHQAKAASMQQYRHETNRAVAEARAAKKQNLELQHAVETANQR